MRSEEAKNRFNLGYAPLIADLGRTLRRDAWWATWLASRDTFSSPLNQVFEDLSAPIPPGKSLAKSALDTAWFSVRLAWRIIAVGFICRFKTRRTLGPLRDKHPYVIKSFAKQSSFKDNRLIDPYFGRLSTYLEADQRKATLTIFESIDHVTATARSSLSAPGVLPWEVFLSPLDVLKCGLEVAAAFFAPFPEDLKFNGVDVTALLRRQYKQDLLSGATLYHLCFQRGFRRMAAILQPTELALTMENHPWERMAILGTRRGCPSTFIVGYQHSVVHETLVNMFLAPSEADIAPLPHRVLTVGKITENILREKGGYGKIPVMAAGALRYEGLLRTPPRAGRVEQTLLVALNGTPQGGRLLRYILDQAPALPAWRILVKEHPAFTISDLEAWEGKPFAMDSYPNVSLTTAPLHDDIARSNAVLYHSSAVCLEALWLGVPVLAFDEGRLLSWDPAQSCKALHQTITAADRLNRKLEGLSATAAEIEEARTFVREYFTKPTAETLRHFLASP